MLHNILEQVGINNYLILAALLFGVGLFGVLYRRNAIVILMSVELMLASANLLLTAFSVYHQDVSGQLLVLFSMAVAAAEVAVGLVILVAIYRNINSIDIDNLNNLKG